MRTSTRSWDAAMFCACRFPFAIRARDYTCAATRRMGSLRTAVSTGVARYSNNHIGAANQAQIKHMAELTLTISTGITTPATPAKRETVSSSLHALRKSSASPPVFPNLRRNKTQCHESHLTRARGLGFPRVTSNAVIFLLLAHSSLRPPRDRVDASCHASRVSRSGARAWLE